MTDKRIYSFLAVFCLLFSGCESEEAGDGKPALPTAYITKVYDYVPAVGQFTNKMPEYSEGDTQTDMNQKVLDAIGGNNRGLITLGGFGGYVVVGFDHTIANISGKCDFRVYGNVFSSATANPDAPKGGSCEPGVIMVSSDENKNGLPDDKWYEIAGSAHRSPEEEPWLERSRAAGNDVELHYNYKITYNKSESPEQYPKWIADETLVLEGTCLPQNGVDEGGAGNNYVLYSFSYGYADNAENSSEASAIDIDWAVDGNGVSACLPGIDFIRIHSGVDQKNGWLGETSTEISGIEDLNHTIQGKQ